MVILNLLLSICFLVLPGFACMTIYWPEFSALILPGQSELRDKEQVPKESIFYLAGRQLHFAQGLVALGKFNDPPVKSPDKMRRTVLALKIADFAFRIRVSSFLASQGKSTIHKLKSAICNLKGITFA